MVNILIFIVMVIIKILVKNKVVIRLAISVNQCSFLDPSSDELKLMMYEHGGKYQHFFSKTHVTHIIATNMPESKIKDLKRFVNPCQANFPFLIPSENIRFCGIFRRV